MATTKKPKPNPFRVANAERTKLKFPIKNGTQIRRDAQSEMRKSRTSSAAPSSRVPIQEQSTKVGTQGLTSWVTGGSPTDKAKYAQGKATKASEKLFTKPAKKGK